MTGKRKSNHGGKKHACYHVNNCSGDRDKKGVGNGAGLKNNLVIKKGKFPGCKSNTATKRIHGVVKRHGNGIPERIQGDKSKQKQKQGIYQVENKTLNL